MLCMHVGVGTENFLGYNSIGRMVVEREDEEEEDEKAGLSRFKKHTRRIDPSIESYSC